MVQPIVMPTLGESVSEGTVTRWLKAVGDTIAVDEPLVEISTDKVDTEVPSPVAGVLTAILAGEDQVVAVGQVLAEVDAAASAATSVTAKPDDLSNPPLTASRPVVEPNAEPAAKPSAEPNAEPAAAPSWPIPPSSPAQSIRPFSPASAATAAQAVASPSLQAPAPALPATPHTPALPATPPAAAYITPLVRRLAKQHGIDLASVRGSGPGGRIRQSDVALLVAEAGQTRLPQPSSGALPQTPPPSGAQPQTPPPSGALPQTPPSTNPTAVVAASQPPTSAPAGATFGLLLADVDVTALVKNLPPLAEAALPQNVTAQVIWATAQALARYSSLLQQPNQPINLAISLSSSFGSAQPVIHQADQLDLPAIISQLSAVEQRLNAGTIAPDQLTGANFTITTNPGKPIWLSLPGLAAHQTAALSVGAIQQRPVVLPTEQGEPAIAIRSILPLTLLYAPGLVSPNDAAAFLNYLADGLALS
ncbi:MAG: 2-oxo acid dehydrogenase subunit E2 [Bifidobacteriaceae bacterium]|jgi:2-oxoglutarate dehydrogenase E2 component (dihydrolipoamide succinyltransferase)|nr:2-oxo acid dehydrogenase subunit E2 [Bifidobacteriaceae bacterium]